MEAQITGTDDYTYRLDKDPITMGCYPGETLTYTPVKGGTRLNLGRCAFTAGAPMTGVGRIDDTAGSVRLAVRLRGHDTLVYLDDANGVASVHGTYRGKPVNLRR